MVNCQIMKVDWGILIKDEKAIDFFSAKVMPYGSTVFLLQERLAHSLCQ